MDAKLLSDYGSIDAEFNKLRELLKPRAQAMQAGGELAIEKIRKRTLSGFDVDGVPFAPYSIPYYRAKSKAASADPVNLYGFGGEDEHMLDAIQVRILGTTGFELAIEGDAAIRAEVHDKGRTIPARGGSRKGKRSGGGGVIPQRHFFDLTGQELSEVEALIGYDIDEQLQEAE